MKQKNKEIKHKENKGYKNKKLKRIVLSIIELMFLCLIIFSGLQIYKWYMENKSNSEQLEEIADAVIVEDDNTYKIDFNTLKEKNADTVGYLKVEGTNIEYPVVHTNNNDYYLSHSFDKTTNGAGWIFADYRNKFDGTDKNTIIYGHNRRDGSMFGSLKNILTPEWYEKENNRYVTFITETEDAKYEVFSVYQTESEDYYIQTGFKNNDFEKFLGTIKQRSVKEFSTEVTQEDTILTLSTCANNNKYRVVLHAKKIQE